jgi:ATP-dependent helicase HrpA
LTEIGWQLSRIPIDPRLGRMILAGRDEHCIEEVLVIAAALSVQDPRERPLDKQEQADEAHEKFQDEQSDFVTYLNLWRWFQNYSRELSQNQLRKLCKQHFLSYVRLREWHEIHNQLFQLVRKAVADERDQRRHPPRQRPRQKHVEPPPRSTGVPPVTGAPNP